MLQSGFSCGENGKDCKLENRDVTVLSISRYRRSMSLNVFMDISFQTIGPPAKTCDVLGFFWRREEGNGNYSYH